ncbi:MAG: P-loop NTPase [Pseudomonadota bacterium]|nr:P-loop NTPase [Pseudomonadota bacterium]
MAQENEITARKSDLFSGPMSIIAVGGGKGGIGKSLISSSLAISIAQLGYSVLLVDLDLGGANLHTCIGGPIPELGLFDFLSGRVDSLLAVATPTHFQRLSLISGSNDSLNIANLNPGTQERIVDELKKFPAQYLILDLGAGSNNSILDFFLMADRKIVALTPEPTSVENAYRFIKSAFYRSLKSIEGQLQIQDLIDVAMDQKNNLGIRTPADLIKYIKKSNPLSGQRLERAVQEFNIDILVNQIRTRADVDLGNSVASVCSKYFGIESNYVGYLDHDNAVWQALRKRRPVITEYPYSRLVAQFLNIAKNLVHRQAKKAVI